MNLKTSLEQCLDESVIDRNNWFMYGRGKPDSEPYKLQIVYSVKTNFPKNYETLSNLEIESEIEDFE